MSPPLDMAIQHFYLGYLAVFCVLGAAAIVYRKSSRVKPLALVWYGMLLMLLAETTCMMAFYVTTGGWTFNQPYNQNARLFAPHPYLVGMPRKNAAVRMEQHLYTHNSQGFRGEEFPPRTDKKRIVVMGGSTSYGGGVNDDETWPFYLANLLGDDYEVLNAGVPGHTTVEHLVFASTILPELEPDVILIHAGLNDVRNLNIHDVAPDYSDFHAPTLAGSLGFCHRNGLPRLAVVLAGVSLLEKIGWYPVCGYHQMRRPVREQGNQEALAFFARNLRTLVAVCRETKAHVVFVPQVLVLEKIAGGKLSWWMPSLTDEEIISGVAICNLLMQRVAQEKQVFFVDAIAGGRFVAGDFGDPSHLSAAGNMKFAAIVKDSLIDWAQALDAAPQ